MDYPTPEFWNTGQSFIVFSPPESWDDLTKVVTKRWQVSPFDITAIENVGDGAIEEARALVSESYKKPSQGLIRLVIIKNADGISDLVATTLLKAIEEPPAGTRFVLLSETRRILPTVRSRCLEWAATPNSRANLIKIPLAPELDFATVSLELAGHANVDQALSIIDDWTSQIVKNRPKTTTLRWLISVRQIVQRSPINIQALLEVTYLHLTRGFAIPTPKEIRRLVEI